MFGIPKPAGRLTNRGYHLRPLRPKQITEDGAARKSCAVDSLVIDGEFLMHRREHRVKEIEILIADVPPGLIGFDLPARLVALRIDVTWPMLSLWIDHDGCGPKSLNVHRLRRGIHVAAMSVKR